MRNTAVSLDQAECQTACPQAHRLKCEETWRISSPAVSIAAACYRMSSI